MKTARFFLSTNLLLGASLFLIWFPHNSDAYKVSEADSKLNQHLECADIMEPCTETEECCSPYVCEDGRCFFAEDEKLNHELGCADIMEPCAETDECCSPYVCEDGRCFFAEEDKDVHKNLGCRGRMDPCDVTEDCCEGLVCQHHFKCY